MSVHLIMSLLSYQVSGDLAKALHNKIGNKVQKETRGCKVISDPANTELDI